MWLPGSVHLTLLYPANKAPKRQKDSLLNGRVDGDGVHGVHGSLWFHANSWHPADSWVASTMSKAFNLSSLPHPNQWTFLEPRGTSQWLPGSFRQYVLNAKCSALARTQPQAQRYHPGPFLVNKRNTTGPKRLLGLCLESHDPKSQRPLGSDLKENDRPQESQPKCGVYNYDCAACSVPWFPCSLGSPPRVTIQQGASKELKLAAYMLRRPGILRKKPCGTPKRSKGIQGCHPKSRLRASRSAKRAKASDFWSSGRWGHRRELAVLV